MNERIRELLVEAGVINNNFNPLAYEQWYLDSLEKFAELIVRECVMLCDKVYEQNDNVKIQAGATFCREDIKEHFGVES